MQRKTLTLEQVAEALGDENRHYCTEFFHRNGIFRDPTPLECVLYYAEATTPPYTIHRFIVDNQLRLWEN